jgi:hypothetical protein
MISPALAVVTVILRQRMAMRGPPLVSAAAAVLSAPSLRLWAL